MHQVRIIMMALTIPVAAAVGCSDEIVPHALPDAGMPGDMAVPEDASVPGDAPVPEDETARVFDTSVLHEIRIEIAPEHIAILENDHKRRVPCTFIFGDQRLENVGIRQKGKGTQLGSLYGKPSFSLHFDEFVPGQKLHGLDKLILNSAGGDPTLLREHIGYDLYRRAGIPSRRSAHAVVTLAGLRSGPQTYGVHVIVEAVNNDLLAREFGEEHDHGNLFEDEDGGDFAGDPYAIDLKDEKKPGHSRERLVEFANFLNTASEEEFAERLEEFVQLEPTLASFALDLLAQHSDGFWLAAHNYYLYEHPADHRFVLIPHGMDLLFGPTAVCGSVPDAAHLPTTLGERIARHPVLRNRLDAAMNRLLDEVWDVAAIEARMDALRMLLETSSHTEPAFAADVAAHRDSLEELKQSVRTVEQIWRGADEGVCGDGVRSSKELCTGACDDGNEEDGDGCSAQCLVEYCGDGVTQPDLGEVCDDEPDCRWDCMAYVVCGDGIVDIGEVCDDGNIEEDDGCNRDCMPICTMDVLGEEVYYFCSFAAPYGQAGDVCGAVGGAPAVPRSASEQAWIVERTEMLAAGRWWIGLDRNMGESAWWPADGLPVTWFAWGPGEPDDTADASCVLLDPDMDGEWNDRSCTEEHPVVCKMF